VIHKELFPNEAMWGPVLLWSDNLNKLFLFFSVSVPENRKTVNYSNPGGAIYLSTSTDFPNFEEWSTPELLLGFHDNTNISKMTANKPIVSKNRIILPVW